MLNCEYDIRWMKDTVKEMAGHGNLYVYRINTTSGASNFNRRTGMAAIPLSFPRWRFIIVRWVKDDSVIGKR